MTIPIFGQPAPEYLLHRVNPSSTALILICDLETVEVAPHLAWQGKATQVSILVENQGLINQTFQYSPSFWSKKGRLYFVLRMNLCQNLFPVSN
jgi:hypothetical protein